MFVKFSRFWKHKTMVLPEARMPIGILYLVRGEHQDRTC